MSNRFLDPLRKIPGITVDFIDRVPGVSVDGERDEVLARLRPAHEQRVHEHFGVDSWWRAEQVHGCGVAVVPGPETMVAGDGLPVVQGVDGLISAEKGVVLGIYVADCGAIWLADQRNGAVGLLHSGKKGTELGVLTEGVKAMGEQFGSEPKDLVGVLGPCIRPPHYEVDFAAQIGREADGLGLGSFHDCGVDTAAAPECYYTYRMEKGRTGRMLALIRGGSRA